MILNCRIDNTRIVKITLPVAPHPTDPQQILLGVQAEADLLIEDLKVAEATFGESWSPEVYHLAGQLVRQIRQEVEEFLGDPNLHHPTPPGIDPDPQT
jgi:hypothetical protein